LGTQGVPFSGHRYIDSQGELSRATLAQGGTVMEVRELVHAYSYWTSSDTGCRAGDGIGLVKTPIALKVSGHVATLELAMPAQGPALVTLELA
jgi:hypothetical protein